MMSPCLNWRWWLVVTAVAFGISVLVVWGSLFSPSVYTHFVYRATLLFYAPRILRFQSMNSPEVAPDDALSDDARAALAEACRCIQLVRLRVSYQHSGRTDDELRGSQDQLRRFIHSLPLPNA